MALMKNPKGRPIRREKNAIEIKCFDFMSYSLEQPGWESSSASRIEKWTTRETTRWTAGRLSYSDNTLLTRTKSARFWGDAAILRLEERHF